METKLLLYFLTGNGKEVSITINNPKDDLDESLIASKMQTIVSANIFDFDGSDLVSAVKAELVSTQVTTFTVA